MGISAGHRAGTWEAELTDDAWFSFHEHNGSGPRNPTLWEPIETAPRDGTHILVWRPHAKRYPIVGEDFWSNKYSVPPCWAKSPDDEQPARWQPLPAPPGYASRSYEELKAEVSRDRAELIMRLDMARDSLSAVGNDDGAMAVRTAIEILGG